MGPLRVLEFGALALVLMVLAYLLVDRLVPGGRPSRLIADQHGHRIAAPVAAKVLGVALIVRAGLDFGPEDSLLAGPAVAALVGLLGVALMSLAAGVIGASLPGRTREALIANPAAAWLIAAGYLAAAWVFTAAVHL